MEHPVHQLAGMAADAAGELRGYLALAAGLPRELTGDDHRGLVPRLHRAVSRLAGCISSIAQATSDDDAKRQLAGGARTILRGREHVQAAGTMLIGGQRDPGPGTATRPPQLAAGDFPQPVTAHLLQAASTGLAPATTAPASPARRRIPCRTTPAAT
jgi:hypothetical protein